MKWGSVVEMMEVSGMTDATDDGRYWIQLAAIIPEGLPRGNSDLRKSGLAPPEADGQGVI